MKQQIMILVGIKLTVEPCHEKIIGTGALLYYAVDTLSDVNSFERVKHPFTFDHVCRSIKSNHAMNTVRNVCVE